jgi:hypothetical protein
MGTAPGDIQAGDKIVLFSGVDLPLLPRKIRDDYLLVAHAYVHGIRGGELWTEDENDLSDITLV